MKCSVPESWRISQEFAFLHCFQASPFLHIIQGSTVFREPPDDDQLSSLHNGLNSTTCKLETKQDPSKDQMHKQIQWVTIQGDIQAWHVSSFSFVSPKYFKCLNFKEILHIHYPNQFTRPHTHTKKKTPPYLSNLTKEKAAAVLPDTTVTKCFLLSALVTPIHYCAQIQLLRLFIDISPNMQMEIPDLLFHLHFFNVFDTSNSNRV